MIKRKDLILAAEELNENIGIEPEIDVDADDDVLKAKLKEANDLLEEDDEISEKTRATLDAVIEELADAEETAPKKPVKAPAKEKVKPAPKKTPEPDLEEDDDEEEEEEDEEKDEKPKAKTKGKPAEKAKSSAPKGPGVIAAIIELVENSGKKGISREAILEKLIEKFPDRNQESMGKTVNVQVPGRINKEKFPLKKLENGNYCKA